MDDALVVHNPHHNEDDSVLHQNQFMPFREDQGEMDTFGLGGTSIMETKLETGDGCAVLPWYVTHRSFSLLERTSVHGCLSE